MTLEATKDATDVAPHTFLVNRLSANILFGSGANYSFATQKFCGRLALPVDKLDNALVVGVANGKFIYVTDFIKNIVIDQNGNKFHEELLPIELNGFYIIIGMDWISAK